MWLNVAFLHDDLVRAVEDMSTKEGGLLLGNPGEGLGQGSTRPTRTYTALSFTVTRPLVDGFVALASYTLSWLRGNYSGFFRPETGQLDPNVTSDFDVAELDVNRTGSLPGDHRHSLKVYAGKELRLPRNVVLEIGAGYTGRSGAPVDVLGAHPVYGPSEVFILPRGAGGRMPWVHRIDTRLGVGYEPRRDLRISASVEVFNVAGSQEETAVDQNYTILPVQPIPNGTREDISNGKLMVEGGIPFTEDHKNPRYQKPTAYQAPRQVRFGLRVDY